MTASVQIDVRILTVLPVRGASASLALRPRGVGNNDSCLLYTSDAADERSSVDLGGRRIIKKKNKEEVSARGRRQREHEIMR